GAGRLANGVGALGFVGLAISGTCLWWPGRWRWKQLSRRLHYLVGIAAMGFIAVLGVTGAYFIWPGPYISAVGHIFARTTVPASVAHSPSAPLALSELSRRAQVLFPGRMLARVELPGSTQLMRIVFREGPPEAFHQVSSVTLNPFT